ncbi:MAG: hypothetical protein Fur005_17130 [Roseiflexaceae bacterium]
MLKDTPDTLVVIDDQNMGTIAHADSAIHHWLIDPWCDMNDQKRYDALIAEVLRGFFEHIPLPRNGIVLHLRKGWYTNLR